MIPLGILASSARRSGASDPHWDKVVALLHFDGNLEDEKGSAWSSVGSLSYVQGKFGQALELILGTGSQYIQSSNSGGIFNFPGEFTVEGWFLHSNIPGPFRNIISFGQQSDPGGLSVSVSNGNTIVVDQMYVANVFSAPVALDLASYHHFAVSRDADSVLRAFIDGVLVGSAITAIDFSFSTAGTGKIGNHPNGAGSVGRVDELRITKGVARYTENFTPPTEPFPNQ